MKPPKTSHLLSSWLYYHRPMPASAYCGRYRISRKHGASFESIVILRFLAPLLAIILI